MDKISVIRKRRTLSAKTESVRAMQDSNDADLLSAVARRRDREAFETLVKPYLNEAYRLALFITKNHDLAEEAVQECMLAVWRKAGTFGKGNVKKWFMGIVTYRSLNLTRQAGRRRRGLKGQDRFRKNGIELVVGPVPEEIEGDELRAKLRECLDELPLRDRHLVALFCAGGLSQVEMAKSLSITQTGVSRRLSGIFERLRARLAEVGMTCTASIFSAQGLQEAVSGGTAVPKRLLERVLARVYESGGQVGLLGGNRAGRAGMNVVAVLIIASLGSGGLLSWWLNATPAKPTGPTIAVPEAADTPLKVTAQGQAWDYYWDFERGLPERMCDFVIPPAGILEKLGYDKGSVPLPKWGASLGRDGSGGLRFGAKGGMLPIPLKIAMDHEYITLSYEFRLLGHGGPYINTTIMALNQPKDSIELNRIDLKKVTSLRPGKWLPSTSRKQRRGEAYIWMHWCNDKPAGIWTKWSAGPRNERNAYEVIYIHGRNVEIDNVQIRITEPDHSAREKPVQSKRSRVHFYPRLQHSDRQSMPENW